MKENKKKTHYLFFFYYKLLFFWIEEIVFDLAEFLLRSGYVA